MKLITLIQASALLMLAVYGAYAAASPRAADTPNPTVVEQSI